MTTFRKLLLHLACAGAVFTANIGFAQENHLQMAIQSAAKAAQSGYRHHPSSLVNHADNAIDHAMMAQKQHKNGHVKAAIGKLRHAIRTAKGTHSFRRDILAAHMAQHAMKDLQAAQ